MPTHTDWNIGIAGQRGAIGAASINTVVLQNAYLNSTSSKTTTSASYVDSTLSATLANNLGNSANLVRIRVTLTVTASTAATVSFTLKRANTTFLTPGGADAMSAIAIAATDYSEQMVLEFYDTPGTVTPASYNLWWKTSTGTARINSLSISGYNTQTTITVEEVAAPGAVAVSGTDFLSAPLANEIAITGAATATLGRVHTLTGTSADYALTLPTGSAGSMCFRGGTSSTQTKVVNLTPSGGQKIGTKTALAVLWDEEVILDWDVTNAQWTVRAHQHATWQTFTPTINGASVNPTKGATNKSTCAWRRSGEIMELKWDYNQNSAGTAGTGDYLFVVPGGFTIDTTIIDVGVQNTYAGAVTILGAGHALQYGVAASQLFVFGATTTALSAMDASSTTHIGSGLRAMSTAIQFTFVVDVPISGW